MRSDIGRFFEGRLLETIKLLQTIYDAGCGAGHDVSAWIDGRELVFSKGEAGKGRGFLRVTPNETSATVCFPRGHELLDPLKRAKGPRGSETRMMVFHPSEIDAYVRRMIDAAYHLEG
jgi:hypothetical protein